jgi:hypothetical protein
MQWFDWMVLICAIIAIILAAVALYRTHNLTAEDFRDAG